MEAQDNSRQWRIPQWFPDLREDAAQQLSKFKEELVSFNGRINLISPKTEGSADKLHIADAILGSRIIAKNLKVDRVHDLGSGNGLPGLVFSILQPSVRVVAIDSDSRKIEFLRHCAFQLKLKNFEAHHRRVEDLDPGTIGAAMTRALGSVSKVLLLSRKSLEVGGQIFHFKGSQWATEIASVPAQAVPFWESQLLGKYSLPDSSTELFIVQSTKLQ